VRFEVLTVTSTKMAVYWDVVPCSLVDIDVHDAAFQKTGFFILVAVKT
jgi:hypothetical protein